jgi:hypothetical protein
VPLHRYQNIVISALDAAKRKRDGANWRMAADGK